MSVTVVDESPRSAASLKGDASGFANPKGPIQEDQPDTETTRKRERLEDEDLAGDEDVPAKKTTDDVSLRDEQRFLKDIPPVLETEEPSTPPLDRLPADEGDVYFGAANALVSAAVEAGGDDEDEYVDVFDNEE